MYNVQRSTQFYKGPPFIWEVSNKQHSNYINCVRYSPDGSKYVTVSNDKRGIIWDGKLGVEMSELDPTSKHKGSIYACAWSPDGKLLATASGDKTIKIWDTSSMACVKTINVSNYLLKRSL